MKKKLISLALAASLVLGSGSFAFGGEISRGAAVQRIMKAAGSYNSGVEKTDIICGYGDGELHEEDRATRAQILIMLKNGFGKLPGMDKYTREIALPEGSAFNAPAWAEEILAEPLSLGIAQGDLSEEATEEELDRMISRLYALYGTEVKDDYYAAVNKNILAGLELAPGMSAAGTLYDLNITASDAMSEIIAEICSGSFEKGTKEQKIADYYGTVMDVESQNAQGISPLKEYLERIDAMETMEDLMATCIEIYEELGLNPYFSFGISRDDADSDKYILSFYGCSASFPLQYYTPGNPVIEACKTYYAKLLAFCGENPQQAAEHAQAYIDFESYMAANSMTSEESAVIANLRNYYTVEQLKELAPAANVDALLSMYGFKNPEKIMVPDPKAIASFNAYCSEKHMDLLKTEFKLALLSGYGACLGDTFLDAAMEFQAALYGYANPMSTEDRAVNQVQSLMPDYLSQLYCEKHFSKEAKADVTAMIEDIIAAYRTRITELDWMSEATKEKAIVKLDNIKIKVGYPDKWATYLDEVEIKSKEEGGSFFSNTAAIAIASAKETCKYYERGVDRDAWLMSPYVVNACYDFANNDITFPAAILQSPMYDKDAPYEENLGKIGYIIAHEISHAFDNNGAEYDEKGNLSNWWTEADYEAFSALCDDMADFYQGREAYFGMENNGRLTLSENVADNGAVQCLVSIARKRGCDMDLLFRSISQGWASYMPRGFAEYVNSIDVHSADKLRVNCVLQNVEEFYQVYEIEEGDGMYLAPETRVRIW